MAIITLTVTVANPGSGNRYYIDGVLQATVSAIPGNTYKFDQADGTNSGHPLRLSITSNGTHSGGSAYTTGVTTSGTPGSAGAYTQIEVTATTVQTLYYYCTQHSNMGGSFNVGSSSTVQLQDRGGFTVQNFSGDQTSVGQIYYNSASDTFKAVTTGVGTWSTGGDLNNGRGQIGSASLAPLTTGFAFGGWDGPASAVRNYAEQYNGTAWTSGTAMPGTARLAGSFGVSTSSLSCGGSTGPGGQPINPNAFEWDGSSWSAGGTMANARRNTTGAGTTTTAGLIFGGGDNPGPAQNFVESYNGTSFAETTEINTARFGGTGAGTQTAALLMGGNTGPTTAVEQWDGSTWTTVVSLNTERALSGGRSGTFNDALSFSRNNPGSAMLNEKWDGTTWTELNDLSVSRYNMSGGGPNTSNALCYGGYGPPSPQMVSTEEWEVPDFTVKTLTTS